MWIEEDPSNKDHRACMITFYPQFDDIETNKEGKQQQQQQQQKQQKQYQHIHIYVFV